VKYNTNTNTFTNIVLFTMLYKVVLTFISVGKLLQCNHSNKHYIDVFLCGSVCLFVCFFNFLGMIFENITHYRPVYSMEATTLFFIGKNVKTHLLSSYRKEEKQHK